jgi:hypothetical protein
MEAAADLERAKARAKSLAASSPGEYLIANQNTGEKFSIKSHNNSRMRACAETQANPLSDRL